MFFSPKKISSKELGNLKCHSSLSYFLNLYFLIILNLRNIFVRIFNVIFLQTFLTRQKGNKIFLIMTIKIKLVLIKAKLRTLKNSWENVNSNTKKLFFLFFTN